MKKKTTPSITKGDFDRAVKQPWGAKSCIVAQFMIRALKIDVNQNDVGDFANSHGLREIQDIFDRHWGGGAEKLDPELQALRASLPIKVKL